MGYNQKLTMVFGGGAFTGLLISLKVIALKALVIQVYSIYCLQYVFHFKW